VRGEREVTSAATIDLSAVDALSADELTAQIALADVVFARVRIKDPRRSSLAYSDAKLVVQVLTADRRRREELAAIAAAEAIVAEAMTGICPRPARPRCRTPRSVSAVAVANTTEPTTAPPANSSWPSPPPAPTDDPTASPTQCSPSSTTRRFE
jgi:hypothetical protein